MKYAIFKQGHKRGEKPLQVINYEPNDWLIGELATQYGPIEVEPEFTEEPNKKTQAQITEETIHAETGLKTNWKK